MVGVKKRLLLSWTGFSVQRFKVSSSLAFLSPVKVLWDVDKSAALLFRLMLATEERKIEEVNEKQNSFNCSKFFLIFFFSFKFAFPKAIDLRQKQTNEFSGIDLRIA